MPWIVFVAKSVGLGATTLGHVDQTDLDLKTWFVGE